MAEFKVESDVEKFIQVLSSWDGQTPSFNECIFGAVAHLTLLGFGEGSSGVIVALADKFEAGGGTVARWAKGVATPMPRTGRFVIAELVPLLRRELEESKRRHLEAHIAFRALSRAAPDDEDDGA